jgi:hypothetical protein
MFWLSAANVAFWVFHSALMVFLVLGWMFAKTRRLHLIAVMATACSWFIFGLWKGIGYCLCTDLHMQVREALGIHDRSRMYVQLMIESMTGVRLEDRAMMWITGGSFALATVMSIWLNVRDGRKRREASQTPSSSVL